MPYTQKEKAMQRALLQYRRPDNYLLVFEALKQTGREDLIGHRSQMPHKTQNGKKKNSPRKGSITKNTSSSRKESFSEGNAAQKQLR